MTASTRSPLYEHGYNIGKHHQLAIGARKVDWFDFPIWQSRSHLQFIINRVAATADLVAIVHPESRNAYDDADLHELTGYHLIEVFNGKFPHDAAWDAALSSGRAVWGIGNDDNHDLDEPRAARRRLDDDQRTVGEHAGCRRRAQDGPLVRGGAHQRDGRRHDVPQRDGDPSHPDRHRHR